MAVSAFRRKNVSVRVFLHSPPNAVAILQAASPADLPILAIGDHLQAAVSAGTETVAIGKRYIALVIVSRH